MSIQTNVARRESQEFRRGKSQQKDSGLNVRDWICQWRKLICREIWENCYYGKQACRLVL